jgi:hypothetical protein
LREQHDRHTYARCHKAIKAVFVVLWGKEDWTKEQSPALWLEKVKAPIDSDLVPDLLFHNEALSRAWRKCLTEGSMVIEKIRAGERTTAGDLQLWKECSGEFLKVALEQLNYLDPKAVG